MRARWRWAVAVVVAAVLVMLPSVISWLPAAASSVSARTLLQRILGSADVPYSGLAETQGGLALPDAKQLNTVAALVGGRSQLRVWYSAPDLWRVDSITPTGETDLHLTGRLLWDWDYESNKATGTVVTTGQIHLPRASDLTPPELGRRLLAHASAKDVTRLATRRIAGHEAAGIRLTPHEAESTIRAVDVWADPKTGLPEQVEAIGKDGGAKPIESHFLDLSTARPAQSTIVFRPVDGVHTEFRRNEDPLESLDTRFAREAPQELAGLPQVQRAGLIPAVTLYGGSVTSLVLVPMSGNFANSLLNQLTTATAIPIDESDGVRSIAVSVGPVNLLVIDGRRGGFVLAGTVTADAMQTALGQLANLT